MSSMQLSLKYRPRLFLDVDGQDVSVRILKNSILMHRVPNAVLLSGIRGTGKTTLARLYAQALNCEQFHELKEVCNQCSSCMEALNGTHPDILEMDAASNNGVDFIRELELVFRQIESYQRRVIIFDEIHMFTPQAQAALLKTLEEPPGNLTFILSTTDPEKLTSTIRSRCLSMPLKPLNSAAVAQNLWKIIKWERKEASEDFVETLAIQGGGSLRDVQQILDQAMLAAGEGPLEVKYLEEAIGIVSVSMYKRLAPVICSMDLKVALEQLEAWYREGIDLELLYTEGVLNLVRDFAVVLSGAYQPGMHLLTGIPAEVIKERVNLSLEYIRFISKQWEIHLQMMKQSNQPKLIWSVFLVAIFKAEQPPQELADY